MDRKKKHGTYTGIGPVDHTFPFVPLPHREIVSVAKRVIKFNMGTMEDFVTAMVREGFTAEAVVAAFKEALA